jgi:protein-S-isoprenylcysteine O-methyltransferase Ste14
VSLAVALSALFALGWLPLFVFRAESLNDALPHYSGSERRWVTLAPAIIATHATLAAIAVSMTAPLPWWRAAVGVMVFAAGIAFWFWGRHQIGPLGRTRLPDEPPPELRRDGAFGLVRNPLYFGYLIAAAAPVLVSAQPVFVATWIACFAALGIRATQEERRLHAQLGPVYADYCRRVKRLIPFVW